MISEPPPPPVDEDDPGLAARERRHTTVVHEEEHGRTRWVVLAVVLLVVLLVVVSVVRQKRAAAVAASKGKGDRATPVAVATAMPRDVEVYLDGLGTVAAFNAATVKSRVDGQLLRLDFREGQTVKAGDLIAELDPRPFQVQLEQAQGQLARDQASLHNAELDQARYKALYAQDAVPKQQYDTAVAAVGQFQGALTSDRAAVNSARLNLTYARVTAPISGRVGLRQVDIGNIVHASDAGGIVVITQLQPIAVFFTLPADQIPQVMPLMHGGRPPIVEAWDRDLTHQLATGALLAVDNAIDPTTGTVKLKAVFDNPSLALFPDQFVNARLLVQVLHQALTVPQAAIQQSPQGHYVYLVKPDRTVESRPVVVQLTEGDDAVIQSGLSPGEQVVVDGADKLRPGAKVEVGSPTGATGSGGGRVGHGGHGGHGVTRGGTGRAASGPGAN